MNTPARLLAELRHRLAVLGRTRLRLALLSAALVATALTVLTSLPAHAEPDPSAPPSPSAPETPGGAGGAEAPTEEEMKQIEQLLKEQGERLGKSAQKEALAQQQEQVRKLLPNEGGVLGAFNVTDANNLPISAYSVKSDTGGMLDWSLGLQNLITEILFMITKWLIGFSCWLIAWSLSFGLAHLLLSPALAVAQSLHTRVIVQMGLPSLALAACALLCVARIFFGDRARGWGDAALSLLIAGLTTTLLASPPQTLLGEDTGALAAARGLSLEIADVILDSDPTAPWATNDVTTEATDFTLSRPLTDALTDSFIVRPAMLLQYGQVFKGACADSYSETRLAQIAFDRALDKRVDQLSRFNHLADYIVPGPQGAGSAVLDWASNKAARWAVNHYGGPPMKGFEKECVKGNVSSAKKASLDKLGGAFFLLIAAIIITVLVTGLAAGFLTAQVRLAWDAIRAEPALIAGTIPGGGRSILWDWLASVLRNLAQMIQSVVALAVSILIIRTVLDPAQTEWGNELTLRFIAVDVVCIAMVKKRKQIAARSRQLGNNFRAKMNAGRIGGSHGSIFTPPAEQAAQNPRIARTAVRGVVRGTLATTALVQGNPLAALGYAMPQSVGATALMSRMQQGARRGRNRPAARPAGRRPGPNTPPRGP
ncbi:hypothetical protein, partial [Streptomyces aurantiacus]